MGEAIQGSKQVERAFVEPYRDFLLSEGHSENNHFEAHMEATRNKFFSFQRGQEKGLNADFEKWVHNYRQLAWQRAKKLGEELPNTLPQIKGSSYALTDAFAVRDSWKELATVEKEVFDIDLPIARRNITPRSDLEKSMFASGLLKGPVSDFGPELDYKTKYSFKNKLTFTNELDELRHIYRAFWYLTGFSQRNWIHSLYDYESEFERIITYRLERHQVYDKVYRPDNIVLMEIDHHEIYVSVEVLFSWIEAFRIPGKRYPIGGCEDHRLVSYAILLTEIYGRNPDKVHEGFLNGELDDEFALLGVNILDANYDLQSVTGTEGSMHWSEIYRQNAPQQELFDRVVAENDPISLTDIRRLIPSPILEDDGEEMTDTESVTSDIPEAEELQPWEIAQQEAEDYESEPEVELPYNPWTRGHTDELRHEFLAEVRDNISNLEESIFGSEESENLPTREISKIDRIGVDLIDPSSRRNESMQYWHKIQLVWGLKSKPSSKFVQNVIRAARKKTGVG
jgi:hypothetical protein